MLQRAQVSVQRTDANLGHLGQIPPLSGVLTDSKGPFGGSAWPVVPGRVFSNVLHRSGGEHNGGYCGPTGAMRCSMAISAVAAFAHDAGRVARGERRAGSRKVQVISLTGGLLCLSSPLDKGLRVEVMFLTDAGAVLGTVEMLSSVSASAAAFPVFTMDDDVNADSAEMIQVCRVNRAGAASHH